MPIIPEVSAAGAPPSAIPLSGTPPPRRRSPLNGSASCHPAQLPARANVTVESLYRMYNEGERPQAHLWYSPDEWEKAEAAHALFGLATSSGSDEDDDSPPPSSKSNKRRLSDDDGDGSSKRRKSLDGTPKNVAKKQSPWHPRAKLVFLACVLHIPPQDRGTIMFLGKACGRNELFARILGIACKKPWGRKQISSHSQTLKQKNLAPPEIQDKLTTTDEQRGRIKTTGGAQGPIMDYPFHQELRKLMGFRPDENLTYAPSEEKDFLYKYIKNPANKGDESAGKVKRAYIRRTSDDSARESTSFPTPQSLARPIAGRPIANTTSPEDLRHMRTVFTEKEREVAAYTASRTYGTTGGDPYPYTAAPGGGDLPAGREVARPRTSDGLITSRSTSFTPSPYSRSQSELKRTPPGGEVALGLHFSPPLNARPYLGRMKASLSAESLGHSRDISEVSELMDIPGRGFWSRGTAAEHAALRGPTLPPIPNAGRRAGGMSDLDKYHHVG